MVLAAVELRTQRTSEGKARLEQLAQERFPAALRTRSKHLFAAGEVPRAIEDLQLAATLQPFFVPGQIRLATLLRESNQSEKSRQALRRLLAAEHGLSGQRWRGIQLVKAGFFTEALGDLEAVHGQRPEDYTTAFSLGVALAATGQRQRAQGLLQLALQRVAQARNVVRAGRFSRTLRQFADHPLLPPAAAELLFQVELQALGHYLELAPGDPQARLRRAVLAQHFGEHDLAIEDYRAVAATRPLSPEHRLSLAKSL